jgi:hypothetical protein
MMCVARQPVQDNRRVNLGIAFADSENFHLGEKNGYTGVA